MKRMIVAMILMTFAVAGGVVDGGYYGRGHDGSRGGWGEHGEGQRPRHPG